MGAVLVRIADSNPVSAQLFTMRDKSHGPPPHSLSFCSQTASTLIEEALMEDLCTLAQFHPDDLSAHAVSLAVLARALNDAHESAGRFDHAAFHRAADLALALYREEKKRFESADASAPLLDRLYLKAFVAAEEAAEQLEAPEHAIGQRFHAEVMRLLYLRPGKSQEADCLPWSETPVAG
jgi:hypothetical protein